MLKRILSICMTLLLSIVFFGCNNGSSTSSNSSEKAKELPTLTFIGHASVKINTKEGKVIYIDPYADGDYTEGADYIFVTHEHSDHNKITLCTQNEGCTVIRSKDALKNGEYQTFDYGDIKVKAVAAGGNKNHSIKNCVGYIFTIDGIKIYHAGDTSMIDQMNDLKSEDIDYAMYPIDGTYNMDAEEASKVADLVGAKHNIPIHSYDTDGEPKKSDNFNPSNKLVLENGQTISLSE